MHKSQNRQTLYPHTKGNLKGSYKVGSFVLPQYISKNSHEKITLKNSITSSGALDVEFFLEDFIPKMR